jgi:hypothetical protein
VRPAANVLTVCLEGGFRTLGHVYGRPLCLEIYWSGKTLIPIVPCLEASGIRHPGT